MAFIVDLEPFRHLALDCEELLAVGWLSRQADYCVGSVSGKFFSKLKELCIAPWQAVISLGVHTCDLCQFDAPSTCANVFIPHQGKIYVAPVAIVHYVAAHRYAPPQVFIDAVLACPVMNSMEYKRALLANGGRGLIRAANA